MKKIQMTAYDLNTNPLDNVLSPDGLQFKSDKPFFLIANIPVKNKTMFEFSITHYYPISRISHIPLYVGVSKEPSTGVLISDFCISSLFELKDDPRYDIMSNANHGKDDIHSYVDGGSDIVGTRSPGMGYNASGTNIDTIGVAVDVAANKISLYVNYDENSDEYNKPFYSYNPPFNMMDEGDLYFCIYSDTSYKDIDEFYDTYFGSDLNSLKYISGFINFGKYGLRHPVPGYQSLYGAYYQELAHIDIEKYLGTDDKPCTINIGGDIFLDYAYQIDVYQNILNNLIPVAKDLALTSPDSNHVYLTSNTVYSMTANAQVQVLKEIDDEDNIYGITNSATAGSNIFINYPIPTTDKIYFEFTANHASNKSKVIGTPISLGLASVSNPNSKELTMEEILSPKSIQEESLRINLYRGSPYKTTGLANSGGKYLYHIINNSVENDDRNDLLMLNNIAITSPIAQGSIIGVALDLGNNRISIYIDGQRFTTLDVPIERKDRNKVYCDFSNFNMQNNKTEYVYFFIHDEGMYNGTIDGSFNFGGSKFSYNIPEGYISLYDFYNVDTTRIYAKDLTGLINIISNKTISKYIYSNLMITRSAKYITDGFNRLIYSDNEISDVYDHYYEPSAATVRSMNEIIASENSGYMPEANDKSSTISFTGVPKYTINLAQYSTQQLRVTVDGDNTIHTEPSFTVSENSVINVECIAKNTNKYVMVGGTPSVTRAVVTRDMFITATPATYESFNVTIVKPVNQTITVYNYKDDGSYSAYTNSFTVNSRYPYIKAEITDVMTGYSKGVIMPEEYRTKTAITGDVLIYSTTSAQIRYNVSLSATSNQVITAYYEGLSLSNADGARKFTVGYNKPIKFTIKATDGYIAGRIYYTTKDSTEKHYLDGSLPELTEDIIVNAEPVSTDTLTIIVKQPEHGVTSISGYKTRDNDTYTAIANKEITVKTVVPDNYYFDHYEIDDD